MLKHILIIFVTIDTLKLYTEKYFVMYHDNILFKDGIPSIKRSCALL